MAMALVHGGAAVSILAPSVFNFLSGMKPSDIIVAIEEVADAGIKLILEKVRVYTLQCPLFHFPYE